MSTGVTIAIIVMVILAATIIILYACLCVSSDAEMRAEEIMRQLEESQNESKEKETIEDGKNLEV